MMAKRSKKQYPKQNKDHGGCMWGLINIFDFRHGRTPRRLLSDKRIVVESTIASESPISEVNTLPSSEDRDVNVEDHKESENSTLDVVKTSVKKLIEEEMVSENDDDLVEFFDSECGSQVKNDNHSEKALKKSFDNHEIFTSYQKSSQYNDLEALMKEILMVYQNRNDQTRTFSVIEEKLSAAVQVLMNEKPSEGSIKKTERSKDLIDMFQMLSSNKELFLKLLHDQNLMNEDRKSESNPRSNPVENEPTLPSPDLTRKHRSFFRRRSKSHESISLNTSRIVILKPNSPDNRFKMENEVHSERFSFMEIKKRLKSAMGKEGPKPEVSEKTIFEGSSGWSSPNRDHFFIERFAKRFGRDSSKLHESENSDTGRHISNIYVEAKKHLSEMLNSGDEDTEFFMERLPKTLGNVLSLPEHHSSSPRVHSRKENDIGFEEKPEVIDEVNLETFVGETQSSRMEDTHDEAAVELENPENQEEMEVLVVSCEQCTSPESIDEDQEGEIVEATDELDSPKCLKQDLIEDNEFSSPFGSLLISKIEETESTSSDRTGRPSPVSILQPLFSDNEISPASSISPPIYDSIEPLCIQFEDEDICLRNHMENEESAFEYIEAVLLASNLDWEEFKTRWLSSIQILDSSLFHEVEIFSSLPFHDQRLLFDSANEILKDVCDCYLNFILQLSFIRKKIQPIPKGVNLINEVWERIELHLKDNYPLSLDHLVKKDLDISRTWMDLRLDSRELLSEIDESIFEDMMDDILLNFFCDLIDDETLSV